MNIETINFIKNLAPPEKAEVMEYIAVNFSEEIDAELLSELDRRSAYLEANPSSALSWDQVKTMIFCD